MNEWTYLEDLALAKAQDTTEFQWLLRSKGIAEIEKRRRFLLGGEADQSSKPTATKAQSGAKNEAQNLEDDVDEMEDGFAGDMHDDFMGETVGYI